MFNLLDVITELHLSPTYEYNFDQMRAKVGNLIYSVAPLIKSAVMSLSSSLDSPLHEILSSPLEEFQTYLRRCFLELRPQLSIARSFDDVIDVVQEKCNVINVAYLEIIVDHYNIEEAKAHITIYKSEVNKFCEAKLSVCENENFMIYHSSSLLKRETIEFVLEWKINEHTLKEIKDLLWKAFGDMAKRVLVRDIKREKFVIVTCYVPRSIIDVLLKETQKNLDLLKKMELISLTIGYNSIWNVCTRDKVRNE